MRKPCKKAAKRFKTVRRVAVRCDENSSEQTLRAPNTRCDSGEKNEVPTVQRVWICPHLIQSLASLSTHYQSARPARGLATFPGQSELRSSAR
ncbi:hypothetical protein ACVWW5_004419 [Bradyrhizobium sp. LM3.4]